MIIHYLQTHTRKYTFQSFCKIATYLILLHTKRWQFLLTYTNDIGKRLEFAIAIHCERFRDRKNGNNRINIGDDWYWPRIKQVKLNLSPWQFSKLKLNFAYWLIDRNYLIHMIWCLCDSSPILFLSYEGVTYYGNGYSAHERY